MVKAGDLVRHTQDKDCNNFGLGIVTSVVESTYEKTIARVAWQTPPTNVGYPADLFTVNGLVVVSEANENDTISGDRNCEREHHRKRSV